MSKRSYWLIDTVNRKCTANFESKTPREAALKAASRPSNDLIVLVDSSLGKIHVFNGEVRPLFDDEKNSFTEKRNIQSKPVVTKLAYSAIGRPVNPKSMEDMNLILEKVTGLLGKEEEE